MHVAQLNRAAGLARDIRDMERDRNAVRYGETLPQRYQDDDMKAAVVAAIKGELQARIDRRLVELIEMGVEVG